MMNIWSTGFISKVIPADENNNQQKVSTSENDDNYVDELVAEFGGVEKIPKSGRVVATSSIAGHCICCGGSLYDIRDEVKYGQRVELVNVFVGANERILHFALSLQSY